MAVTAREDIEYSLAGMSLMNEQDLSALEPTWAVVK
jgi:hypothetical protein